MLAELRGVIDQAGHSPFWDALAGRFFGMSFPEADEFNAVHGTQFIADLMPKTPIYVAMLPDSAQVGDGPAAPDRPRGDADAGDRRLPLRMLYRHFRRRADRDRRHRPHPDDRESREWLRYGGPPPAKGSWRNDVACDRAI